MSAVSREVIPSSTIVMTYYRSALLTQIFAVTQLNPLTLISCNGRHSSGALIAGAERFVELVDGRELVTRYWKKDRIVVYYLDHKRVRSHKLSELSVPAEESFG